MTKTQKPTKPRRTYSHQQIRHLVYGTAFMAFSLAIGILGYMFFARLNFVNALLNASMILTGMGPVDKMTTNSGKIFASFYALYSGVAFLTSVGVLLAPTIHQFFKRFDIE